MYTWGYDLGWLSLNRDFFSPVVEGAVSGDVLCCAHHTY